MLRLILFSRLSELKDFVALGNRVMDYLEGKQQEEVDALTARLQAANAAIKLALEKKG